VPSPLEVWENSNFDGESTTVVNIIPARLRASGSAVPADACKPIPLAEQNDPVPEHPRRYATVRLCVGKLTETVEEKRFYWHNPSHSAGPWRWRQTDLKKQRVSLRGEYVWDVNLTVTKYSDYFVWKDTSERVTRRWDYTSWQEASEFLCIKTTPFFREFSNKTIRQNTPEMLSSMRY